jgi:predicted DNA-binding WGR domain protein
MPSHFIPTDNGKYDFLITITLEGCTVTVQENEGREGDGSTLWHETHDFASEREAQAFYQAEVRRRDPSYVLPIPEDLGALQRSASVYLEFLGDRSHKFYEVTVTGLTVTIRYGRVGTDGQTSSSTYDTAEKAQAAAEKKINEKLKKGYVRSTAESSLHPAVGSSPSGSIPYWLPEDFRVYTNGGGVVGTHPGEGQGFESRILPTVNQYTGNDGGYVAFYSRDAAKAVYSVGGGIYVIGQIRLKGRYIGRIFHPQGYENQDISAAPEFKELCRNTFAVEGWAGGDTGGWFGEVNRQKRSKSSIDHSLPKAMPSQLPVEFVNSPTTRIMAVTLQAGEEVLWQTTQVRSRCAMKIVVISHSLLFSFNLMAGEDFAYHFNPRLNERQIVQNTRIRQHWGLEERLAFPQEMALGQEFELTIAVQEAGLAVYLNGILLCNYQHRIQPMQFDGLRLICSQGSLQVLSVKISRESG